MKILHFLEAYLPLTMTWIYSQIVENGYWKSNVAALHRTENYSYPFNYKHIFTDSIKLFRFGKFRNLLFKYPQIGVLWMKMVLINNKYDVLHCHFGNMGYYALPLKRKLKIPMITMFYGYDATQLPIRNKIWRNRYKRLFNEGDLFLVEGNCMKNNLIKLECKDAKIVVYHLGVDLKKHKFNQKNFKYGDKLKILAAGTFREKKGMPYAIEGYALAKMKYENIELTIIGDATDRKADTIEKEKMLSIINKYNIKHYVKMLGYQPHDIFIRELRNHHLFLSPSVTARDGDAEGGSPVTITEASAAGLPIISTDHCDIPEVVLNNQTGLLVKERDIKGIRDSILYFVNNPEKIAEYGTNARKHIEVNYNLDIQLNRLRDIYLQASNTVKMDFNNI